jgi:hypothetical protein
VPPDAVPATAVPEPPGDVQQPVAAPPQSETGSPIDVIAPVVVGPAAADTGASATVGYRDCAACGAPVASTASFCSNCGHPVGEAVVAASAGIAKSSAAPAATSSARFPVRPVALIATALGLFAFGVALGATLFAPVPEEAPRGSGVPGVVASPSAAPHDLAVNVVLDETMGRDEDPWADVPIGAPCQPTGISFSDIHTGATLIVADQGGTILAKSTLPEGRKSGAGLCMFRSRVTVPDARFYRVGIADRLATVFAFDELAEADWTTDITFVAAP